MLGTALIVGGVLALVFALALDEHGLPPWSVVWGWLRQRWLGILSGLLFTGGLILLIRSRTLDKTANTADGDQQGDRSGRGVRLSQISTAITAFTALAALIFTGFNLAATRQQNVVAEQGHLTDLYTHAMDQLGESGPDHMQTRLGGIYALQHIAMDSPSDRDTVRRVLTEFIRTNSPIPQNPPAPCKPVTEDIQAALTAVSEAGGTELYADLTNTCLVNVRLYVPDNANPDLGGIDFGNSDLQGAELSFAHETSNSYFEGAHMSQTHLVWADLTNASLDGADLTDADLTHADLHGTAKAVHKLQNVTLLNAILNGADLSEMHLVGVNLTGATHDKDTKTIGTTYDATTIGAWWQGLTPGG